MESRDLLGGILLATGVSRISGPDREVSSCCPSTGDSGDMSHDIGCDLILSSCY
jgi:hypothetical protein